MDVFSFGKLKLYWGKFTYKIKIFIFELHVNVADSEKNPVLSMLSLSNI
jgi:hypothetical protein